jgi:hypothetical protein
MRVAAFIGLLNLFHRFRKSTPTAAAQAFFNTIPSFPFPGVVRRFAYPSAYPRGGDRRMSLKSGLSLQEARREAKAILGDVAKGGDPLGEKRKADTVGRDTLKPICEDYLKREACKLRTAGRRHALEKLVYPKLGNRQIDSIKRSEIVRLLDDIEENNGPHRAQAVLGFLSKLFQLARRPG